MSFTCSINSYIQGNANIQSKVTSASVTALYIPGTNGNYFDFGANSPAHFDTRSSTLFMEAWIYSLAANGSVNQQICAITDATGTDWNCFIGTDNIIHFGYWAPSYTQALTGTITFGAWNHVAVGWDFATRGMYVYLNGVATGPTTASTTGIYTPTRTFRIGSETTGSVFNGYIRDLRVIKGGTIPTTSFTPQSAPWSYKSIPSYVTGGTNVFGLAGQYLQSVNFTNLTGYIKGGDNDQIVNGNRIHTFTTIGTQTFTVIGYISAKVLIIAGGGAGGSDRGGGGGAGGYVYYSSQTFTPGTYSVTVGAGGVGTTSGTFGGSGTVGGSGGNSSVTGLTTAIGGGGGGGCNPSNKTPTSGGSGGGGSQYNGAAAGASGTAGQGNSGGTGYEQGSAGGGGGASSVGGNAANTIGGNGGNGITFTISGSSQTYCGGGGGGVSGPAYFGGASTTIGTGGTGGGGNGSGISSNGNANGSNATYYGGGGGGASIADGYTTTGGNGYQGIVIISYVQKSIYLQYYGLLASLSGVAWNSSKGIYGIKALHSQSTTILTIRRSTDNATVNVIANSSGNWTVNTGGSYSSWIGAATGYITQWWDQSGKNNHATQTNTSIQPIFDYSNKQIDFKPDKYFNLPNGTVPYGNTNYTMVVRHNTINGSYNEIIGSGTFNQSASLANALEKQGSVYSNYWWGNDLNFGSYSAGNTITSKYDNTIGRTSYINGSVSASDTKTDRNSTNIQNSIGTAFRGGDGASYVSALPLNGELYYVQIYATALSDTDRIIAESITIT